MRPLHHLSVSTTVMLLLYARGCLGQYPDMVVGSYTDEETGINFDTWTAPPAENGDGGVTFGIVLPENATANDTGEYIGYLSCATVSADRTGWCGIAHDGHMIHSLLLVAYPYNNQVLTSFRWATDYFMPDPYSGHGSPTITHIRSSVNESRYELIYRCQNCFSWDDAQGENGGSSNSSEGEIMLGYAQAADGPTNPACPSEITLQYHTLGYAQWVVAVENVTREDYETWSELAGEATPGECGV